jgi:hypothetical protein
MTTPIIGTDCDITLTHPSVNSGAPFGFIIANDPSVRGGSISVQRAVDENTLTVSIRVFLTVLLADDLKNPDGSKHTETRSQMYAKVLEYLDTTDGLSITTVIGAFVGLAPLGFSATELHQAKVSHIACQFDNISTYHPPITDPNYILSKWNEPTLTWATSYWR